MTEHNEVGRITSLVSRYLTTADDVIYYACTSGYPVSADETYLLDIGKAISQYDGIRGFSGHHEGIVLDVAAYAIGAEWIERHFTFDKGAKGTDHSASLNQDELKQLIDNLSEVHAAMRCKEYMPQVERIQREKLKVGE